MTAHFEKRHPPISPHALECINMAINFSAGQVKDKQQTAKWNIKLLREHMRAVDFDQTYTKRSLRTIQHLKDTYDVK